MTHPSPPKTAEVSRPVGRIRVDDASSIDLLMVLDRALREADVTRRQWSERGVTEMAHEYNVYMRRLRRLIREIGRTRDEMGWSNVQLSELAERS